MPTLRACDIPGPRKAMLVVAEQYDMTGLRLPPACPWDGCRAVTAGARVTAASAVGEVGGQSCCGTALSTASVPGRHDSADGAGAVQARRLLARRQKSSLNAQR
jgi:hypothetical protein